jgi:hypothetical protein
LIGGSLTIKGEYGQANVARSIPPLSPTRIFLIHPVLRRNLQDIGDNGKMGYGDNLDEKINREILPLKRFF